jgi:hypothetical protein
VAKSEQIWNDFRKTGTNEQNETATTNSMATAKYKRELEARVGIERIAVLQTSKLLILRKQKMAIRQ